MLQFEDSPSVNAGTLGKPSEAPASSTSTAARVRVEDKRIINGTADVNQLVHSSITGLGISISLAVLTTGCHKKLT